MTTSNISYSHPYLLKIFALGFVGKDCYTHDFFFFFKSLNVISTLCGREQSL